jgi:hypothetical protein
MVPSEYILRRMQNQHTSHAKISAQQVLRVECQTDAFWCLGRRCRWSGMRLCAGCGAREWQGHACVGAAGGLTRLRRRRMARCRAAMASVPLAAGAGACSAVADGGCAGGLWCSAAKCIPRPCISAHLPGSCSFLFPLLCILQTSICSLLFSSFYDNVFLSSFSF